ncbi:alpha/beta fold hydrolase [Ketobacter alkanivorans]|nr:alpha/beta hydrolase [Ketobacter alkanivorans]
MAQVPLRDGETMNVIRVGRGKPVLLLHGFGSRGAHWLHNVLPYSRQFEFFLPDLRGFGRSHHANLEGLDVFETYANDVQDLLNHFQLDDVILGGVSTGAYTCLTYNQIHGFERIGKYLNIEHGANSTHCPGKINGIFGAQQEDLFRTFSELLAIAKNAGDQTGYWQLPKETRIQFRDTVAQIYRIAMYRGLSQRIIDLAARYAEPLLTRYMMPVEKWQTYLNVMQAFMNGRDTRDALANIQVPTTLMMGRQSRYFSLEAQHEIAHHIPHAKVVIFDRAGHAPMVDQPIQFQREFGRFLRE